jgi:hypothetical protein
MKPVLKAPGTEPLKLIHDKVLSSFPSKCDLRRYKKDERHTFDMPVAAVHKARYGAAPSPQVDPGFTPGWPRLVPALETTI